MIFVICFWSIDIGILRDLRVMIFLKEIQVLNISEFLQIVNTDCNLGFKDSTFGGDNRNSGGSIVSLSDLREHAEEILMLFH
jgi:hypothetical protein